MKFSLFPRLAWTSIKNNRKLYVPYLLSAVGMIMMFLIISSLSNSEYIGGMSGGRSLRFILNLGQYVIAVFSLLFLFYTNSFLIRRRYKEFGLYSILGMGKGGICRLVVWETLITAGISLVGGLLFGVSLSKFAEFGLFRIIGEKADFHFTLSVKSITLTLLIYAAVFAVLLIRALIGVLISNPMELFRSESSGEKVPKANWVFAVLGVLILAAAYFIAVTIQSPLQAFLTFFVAVVMVIVATYLLFIAGSVALCKLLQKNKKYYYKKQHFVSVSSMAYRMKRNGAGLASICILATMVLVMISASSSLYFGMDDAIRSRFPKDIDLTVRLWATENVTDGALDEMRTGYDAVFDKYGVVPEDKTDFTYAEIAVYSGKNEIYVSSDESDYYGTPFNVSDMVTLFFVTDDDYNRIYGTDFSLAENEALVRPIRFDYKHGTLSVCENRLSVVGTVNEIPYISTMNESTPILFVVISDFNVLSPVEAMREQYGYSLLDVCYSYSYNLKTSDAKMTKICGEQHALIWEFDCLKEFCDIYGYSYTVACVGSERADFKLSYGGLFFVSIILSAVFIFAAAIIIYYKQVSEGYEDSARFEIMRKVGMTKEDIKKSINSQVLTVFFAPLIMAGIHLAFAFPMIWKMLKLFYLDNLTLVLIVTGIAFALFALFYAVIYKATAHTYYTIVAPDEKQ